VESFRALINSVPTTPDSCLQRMSKFKACSFGFLQHRELQRRCNPLRAHAVPYNAFPVPFFHSSPLFYPENAQTMMISWKATYFRHYLPGLCLQSEQPHNISRGPHFALHWHKLRKFILWRTAVLRHLYWCLYFDAGLIWEFCFPTSFYAWVLGVYE